MDTIFALASGRGKAGVAVLRVSGPVAHDVARSLAGDLPQMRQAYLRKLHDKSGSFLDMGIVILFGDGASFTGEAVAEFMLHGSLASIAAVERCLAQDFGLRMAEPGEFTKRALENGKMDLTQVEGLSDLLMAETESQRKQALQILDGALGALVEKWRARLLKASALVEASIDFADEDIGSFYNEIKVLLSGVLDDLKAEIAGQHARERVQTGFEVALVGDVNAGKSTLLNALAGREVAITSDIAGTTRDIIEVRMDIHGLAVTLFDTAGLRATDDVVEALGIAKARERAEAADLRVILRASPDAEPPMTPRVGDLVLLSKCDLYDGLGGISGRTGAGISALLNSIAQELESRIPKDGIAVRQRHQQAMLQAATGLHAACERLSGEVLQDELLADDIRIAINALDSLIGKIDVEEILGDIFASFCIGK